MRLRHAVIVASLAIPALAFAQVDPQILREGEGPNRIKLTTKELKAFDAGAWSKLTDWKNGTMSPAVTDGKPVLILTWSDYIPTSKTAMNLAKKMAEKYGARGLVVVAAHQTHEWDKAVKPEAPKDATLLLAHDAKGEFRSAIGADNDPDFFVLDRAGQLRYADIATNSVEAAVEKVVGESREQAGGVVTRLAADAATQAANLRRTDALRNEVDLTALPEIPFTEPPAEAYEPKWDRYARSAVWPTPPLEQNSQPRPNGEIEPPVDVKVSIPESGWFPEKPNLKGRMVLLYFWHPEARLTFRDIAQFDMLQRQHARDLVVVGVLSPLSDGTGGTLKIEADPAKLEQKLQQFKRERNIGHPILVDPTGALFELSKKNYPDSSQGVPIPWVVLISSDSTARWWGHLSRGQAGIDKILANDPGIRMRRLAENKYIREKGLK